ncbi:hypothetical protein GCM10009785_08700 [Brooklawnia cerclae]|uniref:Uncharacterized protein n=1 Tax=Brooklawnia cerclae TaxID=349934 RepID=A0ABX0SNV8_9ACTN|nr:hypothetical protein [Brooklawnia cerclae]NIH58447.1 hypothetical protein [Brooklawnia cerclae]
MWDRRGNRLVRTLVALATTTAVLVVTGCTRQSGTAVEAGHWRFRLDDTWTAAEPVGEAWTAAYETEGLLLQVAGEFSDDIGSRSALAKLSVPATISLTDYDVAGIDEIEVPGAYDALVQQFSYTTEGDPRQAVWIVASQWPYPATAALSLSGEQVSTDAVDSLLATLEFEEYHA